MLKEGQSTRPASACALAAALALWIATSAAWGITGEEIIRKAFDLRSEVRDYKAKVAVTTDIEDVDMPVRHITVYYKRPDKMKVDSEGMVFVPKAALDLHSLGTRMTEDAQATLVGQKQLGGRTLYSVKMVPPGKDAGPERMLVWVWGDTWTVQKVQTFRGQQQLFEVQWVYQLIDGKYWMPEWIVFKTAGRKLPGGKGGEVTLQFSSVQVNVGLADDIFAGE